MKRLVTGQVDHLNACKNYKYSEKDVQYKVREEQRLAKLKKGNLALRKLQLETALQARLLHVTRTTSLEARSWRSRS